MNPTSRHLALVGLALTLGCGESLMPLPDPPDDDDAGVDDDDTTEEPTPDPTASTLIINEFVASAAPGWKYVTPSTSRRPSGRGSTKSAPRNGVELS